MKHFSVIFLLIYLNHKSKNWSKVRKHWRVMVYVSLVNTIYYVLCHRKLVWDFRDDYFSVKFIRLINVIFIAPLIILLFLSRMPSKHQFNYIVRWATGSSIVEWVALKLKMLTYRYGWNLFWTWVLYIKMYLYSFLYSRKPSLVWILTVTSIYMFGTVFKIPFALRINKFLERNLQMKREDLPHS
ncbi:hypothetical protein J2S74_000407 [Evansella vedderi]|uniref:Acyltransferase 3 domain-containing protein n=1 Tax=Evansella vedderi TaxID=38282 RepID=A0ABT9ZP65_9BACI|nr:hypothetical protein [Evansella vedderi]